MKKMKTFVALLLVAVLMAGLLCGCDSGAKMQELAGVWMMDMQETEETARELLDLIDAYDEEIALADLNSLRFVAGVEFTLEGEYRFFYDADAICAYVEEFFDGYFNDLYEGRTTLNDAYGVDFSAMTKEEFQQFYAELYNQTDYASLLAALVDTSYDYEALSQDYETGTFKVVGDRLLCTTTGETTAEYLPYKIEGTTLTLSFSDSVQVYTKK